MRPIWIQRDARLHTGTGFLFFFFFFSVSSLRLHIYTCSWDSLLCCPRLQALRDNQPLHLPPRMEKACHNGHDHFDDASSVSSAVSRSLCSSASDLSDDADYSPPDRSSESSSASSSTLQLESEGPLYELSSLLAQLPARCMFPLFQKYQVI